jgi:hypothetical protein
MKPQYDKPMPFSPEEAEQNGKSKAFLRIVIFENGLASDGDFNTQKMIAAICTLMLEKPEIRRIMKAAVKMHKKSSNNPFAVQALMAILKENTDAEDCQCPSCQMLREIERQQNDN